MFAILALNVVHLTHEMNKMYENLYDSWFPTVSDHLWISIATDDHQIETHTSVCPSDNLRLRFSRSSVQSFSLTLAPSSSVCCSVCLIVCLLVYLIGFIWQIALPTAKSTRLHVDDPQFNLELSAVHPVLLGDFTCNLRYCS